MSSFCRLFCSMNTSQEVSINTILNVDHTWMRLLIVLVVVLHRGVRHRRSVTVSRMQLSTLYIVVYTSLSFHLILHSISYLSNKRASHTHTHTHTHTPIF